MLCFISCTVNCLIARNLVRLIKSGNNSRTSNGEEVRITSLLFNSMKTLNLHCGENYVVKS